MGQWICSISYAPTFDMNHYLIVVLETLAAHIIVSVSGTILLSNVQVPMIQIFQ